MEKRTIAVILILALFVLGASAKTLTLSEGWQLVLENSSTHKLALIDLETAQISYQRQKADNLLTNLEANLEKAENDWEKAQNSYENAVSSLQMTFLENFSSIDSLVKQLEIRNIKLKQAQSAYENGLRKWEIKTIGDAELRSLRLAFESAKNNLTNTQNQLELARMDLASLIGQKDYEVKFETLSYYPFSESLEEVLVDLDDAEKVLAAKEQYKSAKNSLEEARLRADAALDLKEKELAVKKAEINLEVAKDELLKQLIRSFNTLKQSENSYLNTKESYENEMMQYEVSKKQKEAGLITAEALDNAGISLTEQKLALKDSLIAYYKNLLSLEQARGRGEFKLETIWQRP